VNVSYAYWNLTVRIVLHSLLNKKKKKKLLQRYKTFPCLLLFYRWKAWNFSFLEIELFNSFRHMRLSVPSLIIHVWIYWTGILLEDLLQLHPLIWSLQLLIPRKKCGLDFLQKDPSTPHPISPVNLDGRITAHWSSGEALKYNILFLPRLCS
jgi:hypothetical protein